MSRKFLAIAALLFSSLAHADCDQNDPQRIGTNSLALKKGTLAAFSAPVRSLSQLKTHLALHSKTSPLAPLSPQSRQEFINSLTFNENGLTGYNYGVLEKELTVSQIYALLSLLGSQNNISLFKKAKVVTPLDARLLGGSVSINACGGGGEPGDEPDPGDPSPPDTGGGGSTPPDTGSPPPDIGSGPDYKGYQCEKRATCTISFMSICTRNC